MAESERFVTESGCTVTLTERDTDFILELRMVDTNPEDLRRAELRLEQWELGRLHAMTFRTTTARNVPTDELLKELGRRANQGGVK